MHRIAVKRSNCHGNSPASPIDAISASSSLDARCSHCSERAEPPPVHARACLRIVRESPERNSAAQAPTPRDCRQHYGTHSLQPQDAIWCVGPSDPTRRRVHRWDSSPHKIAGDGAQRRALASGDCPPWLRLRQRDARTTLISSPQPRSCSALACSLTRYASIGRGQH